MTQGLSFVVGLALLGCLAGCAPGTSGAWFTPSKPTISISASGSCPRSLGHARDVRDRSEGASALLPSRSAPAAALVCSYKDRTLSKQTRLAAADARELASVVDGIALAAPKGSFNCPAAFDSATVLAFRIGSTDDVDLWWSDSGCQTLDNGRLGAFEGGNPSFYDDFEQTYSRVVGDAAAAR